MQDYLCGPNIITRIIKIGKRRQKKWVKGKDVRIKAGSEKYRMDIEKSRLSLEAGEVKK